MKIKKGDLVKIIAGGKKDCGKVGRVISVMLKSNRVKVEGVAEIKRHVKPQRDPKHPEGGILSDLGTVHVSNVMLMSESQGRPVRTGVKIAKDGTKTRVAVGRNVKSEVIE